MDKAGFKMQSPQKTEYLAHPGDVVQVSLIAIITGIDPI